MLKKKVVSHLKGDIKSFKKEAAEDKKLIKTIKKSSSPKNKKQPVTKGKVAKVMHEFKAQKLHSRSKKGPLVKNPRQAVAIAMSEAGKKKRTR